MALSSRGDAKRMCHSWVVLVGVCGWWLVVVVFVGGMFSLGLLALEIIIMVYVYVIYTCIYIYIYRVVSLFTVSALLKLPFGPPYSCNDFYRTDEILDRESLQNDMDRKDRS